MNLPQIDPATLPQLDTPSGVFGSLGPQALAATTDDSSVVMMVFVYSSRFSSDAS